MPGLKQFRIDDSADLLVCSSQLSVSRCMAFKCQGQSYSFGYINDTKVVLNNQIQVYVHSYIALNYK